jgi:hypothetical protein
MTESLVRHCATLASGVLLLAGGLYVRIRRWPA